MRICDTIACVATPVYHGWKEKARAGENPFVAVDFGFAKWYSLVRTERFKL